jgi:hypothetical protein
VQRIAGLRGRRRDGIGHGAIVAAAATTLALDQ